MTCTVGIVTQKNTRFVRFCNNALCKQTWAWLSFTISCRLKREKIVLQLLLDSQIGIWQNVCSFKSKLIKHKQN